MANVLFDMDIRSRWVFPYFGARRRLGAYARGHTATGRLRRPQPGDNDNFAYQGIFGFAFPMPFGCPACR